MKHGSLESGIGMFDYAAEQMGWENVFHCEINEFCQTVLKYYWPKSKSYANVFEFNGNEWRGKVDIITCGFPCQPFSHAGKREGTKDDRFIWPENLRIIREAKPPFVLAENVPGLITIEDGMVFEQVCLDLENEGYEVTPFIIPACATDKDHRRDRVWIVAHARNIRIRQREQQQESQCEKRESVLQSDVAHNKKLKQRKQTIGGLRPELGECFTDDSNATDAGLPKPGQTGIEQFQKETGTGLHDRFEQRDWDDTNIESNNKRNARVQERKYSRLQKLDRGCDSDINSGHKESWIEAATRLCVLDDGNAGRLDTTSISKSKWRTESLKAAGNTIVWEIAYNIFKAIEEMTKIN